MHPRRRGPLFLAAAVAVGLLVGGCADADTSGGPSAPVSSSTPGAGSAGAATPVGQPVELVSGLQAPWSIVFTADGAALVSERDSGKILEVLDDGTTREVGTIAGVKHGGEGGLLGLAVDGQARLYAYSTGDAGNRVERLPLVGGRGSYGLGAAETIIDGLPSAAVHNGGRIAFGPDGMLYAGVGDAGDSGNAQDPGSLGGKILRLTPDGGVPADNPFPGSPVYSLGHRNVQGLGWADDGTMFASEFGQNTWDELNIIKPGGNYGWPIVEGRGGGSDGQDSGFTDPVQQWRTSDASPSGVAVVDGGVFIANLRGAVLREVAAGDPSAESDYYAKVYGRLRDVVRAPDGALWVLTNNTDGRGQPVEGDDRVLVVQLS